MQVQFSIDIYTYALPLPIHNLITLRLNV